MRLRSRRARLFGGLFGGALLALSAFSAGAQETPPPRPPSSQQPDTAGLVFDREVFVYPRYERRNPFVRLVAGDESGPRFEDIRLIGVIFASDPGASVALLGPREGLGEGQGPSRTYRVRRGDTLGNFRIVEIQRTRVVVVVSDFGMTEQRIMELQRTGQGGI